METRTMARYETHKATMAGKAETIRRREQRRIKREGIGAGRRPGRNR